MSSTSITIRTDIFEHGIFPTPTKIGLINIISLYNSLSLVSTIDSKVTIDQFKDSASKYFPFISQKDAEVYFILFKILFEEDLSFLTKSISSQHQQSQSLILSKSSLSLQSKTASTSSSASLNIALTADLRQLCIFIFLQTFPSIMRHNINIDLKQKDFNTSWNSQMNLQFNESIRGNNLTHFNSPINSPRSKTSKVVSEIQQIHLFIKNNIKTLLKFICNDISSEDTNYVNITEAEFNMLKMIFYNEKLELKSPKVSLSKYTGLYSTTSKANLNTVADWITSNLSTDQGTYLLIKLNLTLTLNRRNIYYTRA